RSEHDQRGREPALGMEPGNQLEQAERVFLAVHRIDQRRDVRAPLQRRDLRRFEIGHGGGARGCQKTPAELSAAAVTDSWNRMVLMSVKSCRLPTRSTLTGTITLSPGPMCTSGSYQ